MRLLFGATVLPSTASGHSWCSGDTCEPGPGPGSPALCSPGRAAADVSAATAVEFALVAPLVIALILGAMQIAVIYLAQAELENAAEQAARLVLTNQAPTQSNFQTAVCGYLSALFTCSSVMVDLETEAV